jgi:hypothetical protein
MSTPNVCEMMRAIRGQPNRGLRDLSSTMALMSAALGPFGPSVVGPWLDENRWRYLRRHQRLMKREQRRGTYADSDPADSSWTEKERPESAEQPVPPRQVRRPPASPAQDDQLLLEQEILRHHRSYTTGANEFRGHDRDVKQSEQEVPHVRSA